MPLTPLKNRGFLLPSPYDDDLVTLRNFLIQKTSRAYLVGGCVRDALLNLPSADYDIEVYDLDETAFAAAMEELGAVRVGRSFHVYKWRSFDLALPRTETKTGEGHTAFSTTRASDERTASFRRDFTVNAMMVHLFSGTLLDFWGGEADLASGTLRLIDPEKFAEDSLRVLRAMQFAARYRLRIDPETLTVCRSLGLDDLSKERLWGEFAKLFAARWVARGLFYANELGILERLFGVTLERRRFIKMAVMWQHLAKNASWEQAGEGFFYLFRHHLHRPVAPMLERLGAPRRFEKNLTFQRRRPKRVTPRFLAALSLRFPIAAWLGSNEAIRRTALKLGVWDAPYSHGVTFEAVMAEGFEGVGIGQEYRRRVRMALRKVQCDA